MYKRHVYIQKDVLVNNLYSKGFYSLAIPQRLYQTHILSIQ